MDRDEIIERGRALHRLLDNEDFAILRKEWDDRIDALQTSRDNWEGCTPEHNAMLVNISLRLSALRSLWSWIDEEIEAGARHQLSREQEPAEVESAQ